MKGKFQSFAPCTMGGILTFVNTVSQIGESVRERR